MPEKDPINPENVYKTSALISISQLLASPLFHRLGVGPSIAIIGLGLYSLHEIGRCKKNNSTWLPAFFPTKEVERKWELEPMISNVVSGGGCVFDKLLIGR